MTVIQQTPIAVSLESIVARYAADYQTTDGKKIIARDWYIDPVKGKVIFILTTESEEE
jgi:hypothetical protein